MSIEENLKPNTIASPPFLTSPTAIDRETNEDSDEINSETEEIILTNLYFSNEANPDLLYLFCHYSFNSLIEETQMISVVQIIACKKTKMMTYSHHLPHLVLLQRKMMKIQN